MKRSATFSDCRMKRYELVRDWSDEIGAPQTTALFVMLNPSKAGEVDDDPTVRKVVGFARRWGFGRAVVVNLIPDVATDPWQLPAWSGIDKENQLIIQAWLHLADISVVAWGSQPRVLCRTISLSEHIYNFHQFCGDTFCIGRTKNGSPLHPSRAPYTDTPEIYIKLEVKP